MDLTDYRKVLVQRARNLDPQDEQFITEYLQGDIEYSNLDAAVRYRIQEELLNRFYEFPAKVWGQLVEDLYGGYKDTDMFAALDEYYGMPMWNAHKYYEHSAFAPSFTHQELADRFREKGIPSTQSFIRWYSGVNPEDILPASGISLEQKVTALANMMLTEPHLLLEANLLVDAADDLDVATKNGLKVELFRNPRYPLEFLANDLHVQEALWLMKQGGSHDLGLVLAKRGLVALENLDKWAYSYDDSYALIRADWAEESLALSRKGHMMMARHDLDLTMLRKVLADEEKMNELRPNPVGDKVRAFREYWQVLLSRPVLPEVEVVQEFVKLVPGSEEDAAELFAALQDEGKWDVFLEGKEALRGLPHSLIMTFFINQVDEGSTVSA